MDERLNRRQMLGAGLSLAGASAVSPQQAQITPSPSGLLAPDHSVIFHNPDQRFYVKGCGLV